MNYLENQSKESLRTETEVHLEKVRSISKFHFFFTSLVFAILSFAIQFPVSDEREWIKVTEALSWIAMGITGLIALKQIGGFSLEDMEQYNSGLSKNWRLLMWVLFVTGVFLLLLAKISNSFVCKAQ